MLMFQETFCAVLGDKKICDYGLVMTVSEVASSGTSCSVQPSSPGRGTTIEERVDILAA